MLLISIVSVTTKIITRKNVKVTSNNIRWKYMDLQMQITLRNFFFKDTHREKALSDKTPALTKSMNRAIWVVGTSN